jgi:hypothetical protein
MTRDYLQQKTKSSHSHSSLMHTRGFDADVANIIQGKSETNQDRSNGKSLKLDLSKISVLAPGTATPPPIQAKGINPEQKLQSNTNQIQRKSDKLSTKNTLLQQAKGGKKLTKTGYTKILDGINQYHNNVDDNNFDAQLLKLVDIYNLIVDWEISHNLADTSVNSKNQAEANRRTVLSNIKTTQLPQEIGAVYQQAKNAGSNPGVVILQELLDATAANPNVKGIIEADYATALRSYSASNKEVATAKNILTGKKRQFMKGGDIDTSALEKAYKGGKELSTDGLGNGVFDDVLDEPIDPNDSRLLKAVKREYQLISGTKQGVDQMSDIEYKSLAAYTGSGYTDMNTEMRGLTPSVSGTNKNQRAAHAAKKAEIQQSILMAASALNKLPDWDGSVVYRGENISGRENQMVQGATIVMPSFTSTTTDKRTASGFSGGSAIWEITGVTSSGKAVSKISLSQSGGSSAIDAIVSGQQGQAKEDEVLLKPYTKLYIDQVIQNPQNLGCKYLIKAHEV